MPTKSTDYTFKVPFSELPAPGEVAEITVGHYSILIEDLRSVDEGDDERDDSQLGAVVRYVPVETVQPSSVVRHAAAVRQGPIRARVERFTLCDRLGVKKVARRLNNEPITNVTCLHCRARLSDEGVL